MIDRKGGRYPSKDRRPGPELRQPRSRREDDVRLDRSRAGEKHDEQGGVLRELDEVKGQTL